MFKKSILAMSAISMVAVPGVADASHYYGYDNGYGYAQQSYYPQQGYYGQGYYNQGYYPQQAYAYGNRYYGRTYGYRYHRCSGTTGTLVGAGAGALLGSSISRGSGYYHRNSGTTGAIIGAALGALVGREVGKSTC